MKMIKSLVKIVLKSSFCLMGFLVLASTNGSIIASATCDEMQVFLSISPLHRENVMEHIAPKLKAKYGTSLITEAIGSSKMISKIQVRDFVKHKDISFRGSIFRFWKYN